VCVHVFDETKSKQFVQCCFWDNISSKVFGQNVSGRVFSRICDSLNRFLKQVLVGGVAIEDGGRRGLLQEVGQLQVPG
jgi:hypothetical protein